MACSCSSNIFLRCSVKPVVIGVIYFDVSSLIPPDVLVVAAVSNVFFNSPTRPYVGRLVCSNCVRRSLRVDDEEYFGD